jgi:YggT family protein
MIAIFYLALQVLKLYSYVVIANVIISWLIAFNILNTQNRFVYSILEMTYKLTDPILNKIRGFLPNLGTLDISPIVLLLLIWFIEMCMKFYIAPMIF